MSIIPRMSLWTGPTTQTQPRCQVELWQSSNWLRIPCLKRSHLFRDGNNEPCQRGGSFLTGKSLPAADGKNKSLRKLRKGGWELVVPGKPHLASYLKTNPLQTCLVLLYWKCCKHVPLHPIFLVQFKNYFGKIPSGFLHKGTLGCINPSSSPVFHTGNLMNPTFLSPDKLLFEGFLKTRSVLRMPTLGFPALLVTSRMSFTFPWALHTSSSSSLVQENGKPDIKSLCFSRVVLYLNTWKKKKGCWFTNQPEIPTISIPHLKNNSCLWDPKLPQSHE